MSLQYGIYDSWDLTATRSDLSRFADETRRLPKLKDLNAKLVQTRAERMEKAKENCLRRTGKESL